MKAPLSWLKNYVDIDCSAKELEEKLFSSGFEVEEVIEVGSKINKIVTCKILEINQHPNADKLSVTKVDAGAYGILQIVTNAKNISVGDVVPVAVDGATLVNGDRIFDGELRGVKSNGMFCSGEELGINDDWYKGASVNGILILDKSFPLGAEVKDLLEIGDIIFDINVTANRPDCQSILGIAREVSALLNKPLKMPDLTYKTTKDLTTKTINVSVKDCDLCPRYIGQLVKNIKMEESPLWLKRRLFSMGIRSINNIVDITNYVLLEIGQPMHAFDLNDLEDNSIIVRRAKDGEKITTLDNKEFNLKNSNLVICDGKKPVALAGIMGGLNSEIKDSTKNIVLESAKFARDNIRKTSRAIGQRTDSSSRFEKGIDAYSAEIGMKRALNLIDQLNCGEIADDYYNICSEKIQNKVINTTISRVNAVLGIDIDAKTIEKILTSLFFEVKIDGDNLQVKVPLFREDIDSYPDIAEELIREYGYDNIVPTLLKTSSITFGGKTELQAKLDALKDLLVGFGFNEILTYSFVSEKEFDLFSLKGEYSKENAVRILNPLGEDLAVMRTSLLPSAVRSTIYNVNRKNYDGRLFELAKTYRKADNTNTLPTEKTALSISMFGEEEDFFTLKGVIESIFNAFANGKKLNFVISDKECMHSTRSADILINEKIVGYFGQLNPELNAKLGCDKPIFVAEIYVDLLIENLVDKITFSQISKFPAIDRDLAIIVDESVPAISIKNCIEKYAGMYLTDIKLFDVYKGEQLESGKKSIAYRLQFVSNEKTLNVEEIELAIKNILLGLSNELGAKLR